jgi:methyl-accepting chemotaxis protein
LDTSAGRAVRPDGHHADDARPGILTRLSPHHLAITIIGVFVALIGVGVLIAVLLIVDVGADASAMTDRHVRYAVAIDAAALHAKAIANDERGFLLSGDEEFVLQSEIRQGLALARFADAIDVSTPESRDAVVDAQAGFERWLASLAAEFDLYRAGQEDVAVAASLAESRELRKEYEASLALAREFAAEGIRTASDSVSSSTLLAIFILVDYLVLAAAIGIALTGIVLRTVKRTAQATS